MKKKQVEKCVCSSRLCWSLCRSNSLVTPSDAAWNTWAESEPAQLTEVWPLWRITCVSLLRSLFHPNLWCLLSPAYWPQCPTPMCPPTPPTPPTPNLHHMEPSHLQLVPTGETETAADMLDRKWQRDDVWTCVVLEGRVCWHLNRYWFLFSNALLSLL